MVEEVGVSRTRARPPRVRETLAHLDETFAIASYGAIAAVELFAVGPERGLGGSERSDAVGERELDLPRMEYSQYERDVLVGTSPMNMVEMRTSSLTKPRGPALKRARTVVAPPSSSTLIWTNGKHE